MRIHEDKHGRYDLDEVHSITPLPVKGDRKDPEKVTETKALLHFKSGAALHTDTDYDTASEKWAGKKD